MLSQVVSIQEALPSKIGVLHWKSNGRCVQELDGRRSRASPGTGGPRGCNHCGRATCLELQSPARGSCA